MSWFDLAALVVVALAVFDGARNGLLWAALETVLVVGTAAATRTLSPHVEPYIRKVADFAPGDLVGAAHVAVFTTSAAGLTGVLILLKPATRRRCFERDGYVGGALGAVNGVTAALLVFAIVMWPERPHGGEESLASSRLLPTLQAAHDHGFAWLFPEYVPSRLSELRRP